MNNLSRYLLLAVLGLSASGASLAMKVGTTGLPVRDEMLKHYVCVGQNGRLQAPDFLSERKLGVGKGFSDAHEMQRVRDIFKPGGYFERWSGEHGNSADLLLFAHGGLVDEPTGWNELAHLLVALDPPDSAAPAATHPVFVVGFIWRSGIDEVTEVTPPSWQELQGEAALADDRERPTIDAHPEALLLASMVPSHKRPKTWKGPQPEAIKTQREPENPVQDVGFSLLGRRLDHLATPWVTMKRNAGDALHIKSVEPNPPGGKFVLDRLNEMIEGQIKAHEADPDNPAKIVAKVHLAGHSAGAIFVGHLATAFTSATTVSIPAPTYPDDVGDGLPRDPVAGMGRKIESVTLLAPACTLPFFRYHYAPALRSGGIGRLLLFSQSDERERTETYVIDRSEYYSGSLLYLLSEVVEAAHLKGLLALGDIAPTGGTGELEYPSLRPVSVPILGRERDLLGVTPRTLDMPLWFRRGSVKVNPGMASTGWVVACAHDAGLNKELPSHAAFHGEFASDTKTLDSMRRFITEGWPKTVTQPGR